MRAALALSLLISACGVKKADDSPVGVMKQFLAATQLDDTEQRHRTMYEMLGPRTRARLKAAAATATKATGGAQKFAPHQMLSASFRPGAKSIWEPKLSRIRLKEKTKTIARVEVVGDKDHKHVVTLVRVDGKWKIEFDPPTPSAPTTPR